MKKNINIISIILLYVLCILPLILFSQRNDTYNRSKQLIDRYNKIRIIKSLPIIQHDTILDDVTTEILLNKKYRKSDNTFNEDSIRYLFYNSGVMDYKYEILEILDKDTSAVFNSFLLADSSSNLRMSYSRNKNNLLLKTKSYLKYDFGEVYVPRITVPADDNIMKSVKVEVKTDSIVYYVKPVISGKYYYYYSNHIPLSLESVDFNKIYEVKRNGKKNPFSKELEDTYFNLRLTSIHPEMYLIVINEKNEIIAILK